MVWIKDLMVAEEALIVDASTERTAIKKAFSKYGLLFLQHINRIDRLDKPPRMKTFVVCVGERKYGGTRFNTHKVKISNQLTVTDVK